MRAAIVTLCLFLTPIADSSKAPSSLLMNLFMPRAQAQTLEPWMQPNVFGLAALETEANGAADQNVRVGEIDRRIMAIPYVEVPLEVLTGFESRVPDTLRQHFIFERSLKGVKKTFVRWILNPKDTEFKEATIQGLRSLGVDTQIKTDYFEGRHTASRSLAVRAKSSPDDAVQFTVKVSTNYAGGTFNAYRPVSAKSAELAVRASHYIADIDEQLADEQRTLRILPEPLGFAIQTPGGQSFGMSIREYDYSTNEIYLPGFSALHEEFGRRLAEESGMEPAEFWFQNYILPVARANIELWLYYGLNQISPHSQQYLRHLKQLPSGKHEVSSEIFLRDPIDTEADFGVIESLGVQMDPALDYHFREGFYNDNPLAGKVHVRGGILLLFGPFNGTPVPSWVADLTPEQKSSWEERYVEETVKRFSEITEIPFEKSKTYFSYSGSFWNDSTGPLKTTYLQVRFREPVDYENPVSKYRQWLEKRPRLGRSQPKTQVKVLGQSCAYLLASEEDRLAFGLSR